MMPGPLPPVFPAASPEIPIPVFPIEVWPPVPVPRPVAVADALEGE
jgi:hypothetical protein